MSNDPLENSQKKRILVFHPALAPYRVDFFNVLNDKFKTSFYFDAQNVKDQNFNQELIKERSEFRCNYLHNGLNFLGRKLPFNLFQVIKNNNPDILFCSEYGPVTIMALLFVKLLKKKIKIYTLSDDSIDNAINRKGLRSFLRGFVGKYVDGVIFTSEAVCLWHQKKFSNKIKTFQLPIIHDDKIFRPRLLQSLNQANVNIKKFQLQEKKIVLFVGRLVEVKNIDFLIRNFARLGDDNTKLIIVGEGERYSILKALVAKLSIKEKVIFVGRKEGADLYSWYALAQVFVLPSTHERFGAVVNEALLSGYIVACSELAGASVLINKENGKLFNPYSDNEFLVCLEECLEHISPISEKISNISLSRMPFTFEEKVNEFIIDLMQN